MHSVSSASPVRRLFLALTLLSAALALPALVRAQTLPTWTVTTPTALLGASYPNGLAYGNGFFVVTVLPSPSGGNSFVLVSPNGTTWARAELPETGTTVGSVHFLNGRFWTTGTTGTRISIYSSANGSTWTVVQTLTGSTNFGRLADLAFSGGTYLAQLGNGFIGSADNGVTWTVRGFPAIGSIQAGVGIAGLVVGNTTVWVSTHFNASGIEQMFRSTDAGQSWSPIPGRTGPSGSFTPAFVFNNQFVNYDAYGTTTTNALVSDDGLAWSQAGASNNRSASFGGTAIGPGYRVANSVNFNVATTRDNVTFTNIGILPGNRAAEYFAIGDTTIVGMNSLQFGPARFVVGPAPGVVPTAPTITTHPQPQTVAAGGSATFSVAATGTPAPSYEWRFNNTPIAGATAASYAIPAVTAANAGSYTVRVFNTAGTTTSNSAALTVTAAPPPAAARLVNLSILTSLAGASDSFTMGYVVGGSGTSGTKPLVIRAAGPALTQLGVAGALADPKLELFAGAAANGSNDNWGGGATLLAAMTGVGAFPFASATSLDAAASVSVAAGDNSVKVSPVGNISGQVIAEIYDATPDASFTATTRRLVNVSVLKNIGTSLTAGFVIRGTGTRTVLIRAVGPTLGAAPFNVPGVVADPQLTLFNSAGTQTGANDNWGGSAALSAAFDQVGAFVLPAASRDAALLATLQPGNYTVQVTGVGGTTGTALVEVYEVP